MISRLRFGRARVVQTLCGGNWRLAALQGYLTAARGCDYSGIHSICSHMITAEIQSRARTHWLPRCTYICVATCSISPCVLPSAADLLLRTSSLKAGSKKTRGEKNAIRAGFDGGHGLALFRAQPLALRDAVHVLLTSSSLRLCRKLIALKNYLRRRQDVHSWPVTPPEKKKKEKKLNIFFQQSLLKNMNSSCNGIAVCAWYRFYFRL